MEGRVFGSLAVPSATYKENVDVLKAHFVSDDHTVTARFRFPQWYKQQGESGREYVASLRQLARKCKFGETEEELVRDQLIERTNNVKV